MFGQSGTTLSAALLLLAFGIALVPDASADLRKPLSDAEIDRLAAEWDKDEEEDPDDEAVIKRKMMERGNTIDPNMMKGGQFDAKNMMAQQAKGQTKMIFVNVNPNIKTKEEAQIISQRWTSMLMNNALELKTYPIEDKKFLYVVDDGSRANEVIDFLSKQDDVDTIDLDSKTTYGPKSWTKAHPNKVAEEKKRTKVANDKKRHMREEREEREKKLKEDGGDPFDEGLKKKKKKSKKKNKKKSKKAKMAAKEEF